MRGADGARPLIAILLLGLLASPAGAREPVGGHLKAGVTLTDYAATDAQSQAGANPALGSDFNLRLKFDHQHDDWDTSLHYEVLALQGDGVETRRRLVTLGFLPASAASGLPNDDRRLFRLTDTLRDHDRSQLVHRLDRLSVGVRADRLTVRVGRQAVSLGNGLAFQVLDIVNPFAPLALDKEYKTGDDMLLAEWQGGPAGEFRFFGVPRRDPLTHALDSEQGTAALKWRMRLAGTDLDLLAARHYDETLTGFGLARGWGGAVWRADVAQTQTNDSRHVASWLLNADYSWSWFGRNFYGFAELYRNGFGVTTSTDYLVPPAALSARLARGELFVMARHYAAFGMQVEMTPLVTLGVSLIANRDDDSRLWQGRLDWSLAQNLTLQTGVQLPDGRNGSEYGGLPTATPGVFLGTGRSAWFRLAQYF